MDLERLLNGAFLGALIGLGLSVTSDASTRITQKHLKGYDNLDPHAANLAFKLQSEWGEALTHRLIKRMDTLSSLAAILDAGTDTDIDLVLTTAERAHHVYDRIRRHVNHLMSVDNENVDNKETLSYIQEWAQCVASNIDVLVRQKGGVTAPPVPCEYNEAKPETPEKPTEQAPNNAGGGLLGMAMKMMGGMFARGQ